MKSEKLKCPWFFFYRIGFCQSIMQGYKNLSVNKLRIKYFSLFTFHFSLLPWQRFNRCKGWYSYE